MTDTASTRSRRGSWSGDRSDLESLLAQAIAGRRGPLGRLLSLLENSPAVGQELTELGREHRLGEMQTIGITGLPGAGKSTMVSQLASSAREAGGMVAVLAVDPSSPQSGGALLGDRARMDAHVTDTQVFIRSIATRGEMGGLARVVPQAIELLDVVGFKVAIVETVGVGQVEVDIADEADTTVVVLNPGWGDWLQANKSGLLEVADIFVMNKADRPQTREAVRDLERMLDDTPPGPWRPPVLETVSTKGEGISELWQALSDHGDHLRESGLVEDRRRERRVRRMRRSVGYRVQALVSEHRESAAAQDLERRVASASLDPEQAAANFVEDLVNAMRPHGESREQGPTPGGREG